MSPSSSMRAYTAFLRGINVGGNNPIKMDALRTSIEDAGFMDVKTVLASGNVVFKVKSQSEAALAKSIEKCIEEKFGRRVGVIVRSIETIRKLVDADPFKGAKKDPSTKLYVTFLPGKVTKHPKPPAIKGISVVSTSPTEVFSSVTLSAGVGTLDLMSWLDKSYGKGVTTRTWNTIAKVLKATED